MTTPPLPPVAIPPSIYEPEGDVVTQPNGRLIRAVEQEDGSIVVYVKPYQGQGEVPELILSVVGGTDDPAYCSECVGPCRTPYCAACGDEHAPGDCAEHPDLVDPCDYCSHDNTEHAEDGCRLCPCAVPQ